MNKPLLSHIMKTTALCSALLASSEIFCQYSRKVDNWSAKQECKNYEKIYQNNYGYRSFVDQKFTQAQREAQREAQQQNPTISYRNRQRRFLPSRPSRELLTVEQPSRNNRNFLGQ